MDWLIKRLLDTLEYMKIWFTISSNCSDFEFCAPFDLDFSCKSHDSFEFLKLSSGFACGFCSSFYSLCDASFFLISITFFRWRGAFDSWCIFSPKLLVPAMITIGSSQFLKAHIALKQPFQAVFHCVKLGGCSHFFMNVAYMTMHAVNYATFKRRRVNTLNLEGTLDKYG